MKNLLGLIATFVFSVSSLTSAATNKICFGSKQDDDTRGVVMSATISKKSVTLKTLKEGSNFSYNGSYPTYGTKVKGRDGHIYLEYKGENLDYQDVIMVDEDLLQAETKGLLQIRARGEGFFNDVFFCRDEN